MRSRWDRLLDDGVVTVIQVLLDVLEPEDTVSCLLSLLHRVDESGAEHWSVKYTLMFPASLGSHANCGLWFAPGCPC